MEVDGKSILFKSGKPGCDGNSELGACRRTPDLDRAQGTGPPTFNYHGTEGMEDAQNLADLSSDFANTLMLDEELELEQKTLKNGDFSPVRRYCMVLYLFGSLNIWFYFTCLSLSLILSGD